MTTLAAHQGAGIGAIDAGIAPKSNRFDPFGIVSGLRAYRIYSELDAKSDADLAAMGLRREDIGRAAFEAATL